MAVVDFLLGAGLLREDNGKLRVGPRTTHLESDSPWVRVHHLNWRARAAEHFQDDHESQLHYTCPMTISTDDGRKIREMIVQFLQGLDPLIEASPSEGLYCLNIDWFPAEPAGK